MIYNNHLVGDTVQKKGIKVNIYINKLFDDYIENKIDYNELHYKLIKILKKLSSNNDITSIKYIYSTLGIIAPSIYMELFSNYPQILNFLDDINLKLEFIKKYSNKKDLLDNQTILLKYEWDQYTGVNKNEQEQMSWIKDFLKYILYDMKMLAKNNGYVNPGIKYLSSGSYFQVYRIGDEVLKIGERKHNPSNDFSYNYIVAHLSREFSESYTIEVCPYAKMSVFTYEDVQKLYDEERKLNYCWADCKEDNIGILIRDNVPYYINLNDLGYEFLGINKELENYKKNGDYIIIDRDFCYNLNNYDINKVIYFYGAGSWVIKHEESYQKKLKK